MVCNCIGRQNGDPRCPCMMNRRKDDPPYFYESRDHKGYLEFVYKKPELKEKLEGWEDEL